MTEYQAISLFNEQLSNLLQLLFGYISILSAFLVMSYFAASKLNKWLMPFVLALFSGVSLLLIVQLSFQKNDMEQLYSYIMQLQAAGNIDLIWFGSNPAWAVALQTILQNLVAVGGYIGCMVFFFYQRTHDSDNELS